MENERQSPIDPTPRDESVVRSEQRKHMTQGKNNFQAISIWRSNERDRGKKDAPMSQTESKTQAKHTTGEWYTHNNRGLGIYAERRGKVELIANAEILRCNGSDSDAEHVCAEETANAKFICKAVNSYQAMYEALWQIVELCDDGDADMLTQEAAKIAKAALRLAEAGA